MALQNEAEHQQRPHWREDEVVGPAAAKQPKVPTPLQRQQEEQVSHFGLNVDSSSLIGMFKLATVV